MNALNTKSKPIRVPSFLRPLSVLLVLLRFWVLPHQAAEPGLRLVGSYDTSGSAQSVTVSGNRAYVADFSAGMEIIDVSDPSNPVLLGQYDSPGYAWGVAIAGNFAYLADEATGLIVLDVSDPSGPERIGGYNTSGSAFSVSLVGSLAYVADGEAGLIILDVSTPATPHRVGSLRLPGEVRQVVVSGNYAYLADRTLDGTDWSIGALHVIDVSDPTAPTLAASFATRGQTWTLDRAGDFVYLGADELEVIDVRNPAQPLRASTATPGGGVAYSDGYVYVANFQTGLTLIDVHDPRQPRPVANLRTSGYPRQVTVAGKYAYIAADFAGLLVVEVSGLQPPTVPALSIARSGQTVVLKWPASAAGAVLQRAERLQPDPVWSSVGASPALDGDQQTVKVEIGPEPAFFRLYQP